MADDIVRVTGKVLRVDHREGFAKATGAAYAFDTAQVLVGGLGLCSVDVPPEHLSDIKGGVDIDIAATLSVYNGRPILRPLSTFPKSA